MRNFAILLLFLFPLASTGLTQITTTHGDLKLVHAKATITKERVKVTVIEPRPDQLIEGADVTIRFTLQNWIPENGGKHLHFILDNQSLQEHYSNDSVVFRGLSPGAHILYVFAVYPWHETVKQQPAISMISFFVKEKTGSVPIQLNKPMMIYNTPVGTHRASEEISGQPHPGILIDWFLHGAEMGSRSGFFVRISVDGQELTTMKEWRPHYIQGLSAGQH